MLLDVVGVGKTLQAIGAIVARQWFISYHDMHNEYLGSFGECSKSVTFSRGAIIVALPRFLSYLPACLPVCY